MTKNKDIKRDSTTEEKIIQAAKVVFHRKGFAATRTRDIAEESGINLALLNYYFRNKQTLFNVIMENTMKSFLKGMMTVFFDSESNLDQKVEALVNNYFELLLREPDVPLFILSELKRSPDEFISKMSFPMDITKSSFFQQIKEGMMKGEIKMEGNPFNYFINIMSLCLFPFAASPLVQGVSGMDGDGFVNLMLERKKMIPMWVKKMTS